MGKSRFGWLRRLLSSLRFRLSAAFAVLLAAVLVIINYYPVQLMREQVIATKETELWSAATTLAAALESYPELTEDNVYNAVRLLDVMRERRILAADAGGIVIYDSSQTAAVVGRLALFPEMIAALSGRDVFRCRYSETAFESCAAVPVMRGGETAGAVYFYDYDTEQAARLRETQGDLYRLSIVLTAVSLLGIAAFMLIFSRRLGLLLRGVKRVGQGEYSYKIQMRGQDELSAIGSEFNVLTGQIQKNEEMRRQFVSDASHELKTPLASIRLLSDSILQTKNISREDVREFLTDINEEIERLTRISESLLDLTRLDAMPPARPVPCDVDATVRKCADLLRGSAAQYGVSIELHSGGRHLILADPDGLYQVVFNLMENAVKYNRRGGKVVAGVGTDKDMTVLTVCDTGIGIPPEHLNNIFQRFYRVDKTRSRATGGTGLGLAIVDEWVRNLGGRIEVRSENGKGSEFTVRFVSYRKGGAGQ